MCQFTIFHVGIYPELMRHIVVCNNYFYSVWLNYSIKYILYFDELEYNGTHGCCKCQFYIEFIITCT